MKPAAFGYAPVTTVDEALAELARHGDEAKLLAGGQSLIPMLNMRLAAPSHLIDLNRVHELAYIEEREGGVAIGAMTRQRAVERSPMVGVRLPLLADAMPWVGHIPIRTRGTIGGSLAHADPAAEIPAVALCLDARVSIRGPRSTRTVAAAEFFQAALTTVLAPTELVAEIWCPAAPSRSGAAWVELARRHGDYALVGVGVMVTMSDDVIADARLTLTGVAGVPVRMTAAEAELRARRLTAKRLDAAVAAVRAGIEPESDLHATAAYRRHVAGVLAARAVRLAVERAQRVEREGP